MPDCPAEQDWTVEEMSSQLQNWTIKVAFLSEKQPIRLDGLLGSPPAKAVSRYLEGCG
jgi:hypothetical protein